MNELPGLLKRLVEALDAANVPFMIAGSFASTAHGRPRSTQDIDVVIAPKDAGALDVLLGRFSPEDYYVDIGAARDAMRRRTMFNLIDNASGWKVDFIFRKSRAFSLEEFARRQAITLLDVPVFVASPEDTIVAKLEWSQQCGGSERQRRDVAGILETIGDHVDVVYLERWVKELGLEDEWLAARSTQAT